MKRVRKRRVRRGKAAPLQVLGPDQRMMGEVLWMEGELTGQGEGWTGVKLGQPEGRWTGVGRCLQLELYGIRAAAAALREDELH